MKYKISLVFLFIMIFSFNVTADEIYLNNGDKISGKFISESESSISFETEAFGALNIEKKFVSKLQKDEIVAVETRQAEKIGPAIEHKKEASIGYSARRGNTNTSSMVASFLFNRNNKHVDEFTAKGNFRYSSSEKKMDGQKWYGLLRYAQSFGFEKKWYRFIRLEGDHDRFANINYRIAPVLGVGYWWKDTEDFKLMTEIGLGAEYTNYRDDTKDTTKAILAPRLRLEKTVFEKSKFIQDIMLYPQLEDFSNYRLRFETSFSTPLSKFLSLKLSLIDHFNSNPPDDIKKNDLSFLSSLVYSF